ncbi:uncharacterized protein L3040_005220 [Drepanopeziza brunnea f. sp. 'multigermtubi']|uniref:uncharacterized protein n=1 Tax=Drepanopeziza brunnea f. sp. 'multigermtubi' TaxID=698441 RepID=UPI0023A0BAB6|nr:hypothetical protein L3040_005220 [Drepanopeziza brunnea f. sp. 'multigermtubi']
MAPSTALERRGSILITGANGGLGSAFVANFTKSPLGKQYRGLYTVRNPSSATELEKVLGSAPAETTSEVFSLDLGSLESVRSLAADINARVSDGTLEPIRAVILNAGFQNAGDDALEPTSFTVEGYEMAFGAN